MTTSVVGADLNLKVLRMKSLVAIWLVFVVTNVLSKTIHLLIITDKGIVDPIEEDFGWVAAFLAFFIYNVPDLISVTIYAYMKWVVARRRNSEGSPHFQQQQQQLGPLPVHGSEEDEGYYHGIYVGIHASASASTSRGAFPVGVEVANAPRFAGEQDLPGQVYSKNAEGTYCI